VADARFRINTRVARKLRDLSEGTVDYSPHAHIVFEVRDDAGQLFYQHRKLA
jgi:hypothetical protein